VRGNADPGHEEVVMVWVGATAASIARAVRRGDASATEVVDQHLARITTTDQEIGAFRVVRTVNALAEAEIVDELPDLAGLPLAGVPIAVKENVPVAGERACLGSAATLRDPADADHETVRRLRGAGAVVVGLTRMPELGLFATTDDQDVITRNPWRLDRTAGGSSGGSAAAVASGAVPMALGNDGLGSIRIPAACCGLVGLKPGRGVVPAGLSEHDWFGLVENGVLTRTVADAAIGFAVLAGRTPRQPPEPGRLRLAVALRSPVLGVFADHDSRQAAVRAAQVLVAAGHSAHRAELHYPQSLGVSTVATWLACAHLDAQPFDLAELQPRTRTHAQLGRWTRRLVRESSHERWRHRVLRWLSAGRYDLLLTPVLAGAPPLAESWSRRGWRASFFGSLRYAPYAAPWNVAGLPAISVPSGTRQDGLPGAVQIVGPPGSEELLLAVAAQLEKAAPWPQIAPRPPKSHPANEPQPAAESSDQG
jgi:amidase